MTRLGRPTGPKPGFTRAEVVAAALALGVADFTLAGIAARLGVAASALYRTISSREDLLRACLSEIAARIDFTPDPDDWRRNARNQADALWALLEAHPGLDCVLLTVPWAAECFADTIGAAHRAFMAAGMSEEDAALAVDVVGDTVISSHVGVTALRANWTGGAGPRPGRGASALPTPFLLDPSWLERGWLDRKIDLLVDGLEARLIGAGAAAEKGSVVGAGAAAEGPGAAAEEVAAAEGPGARSGADGLGARPEAGGPGARPEAGEVGRAQ